LLHEKCGLRLLDLPYASNWEAEGLLAMENAHKQRHPLIAVVGDKNGLHVHKAALDDEDPLAGLKQRYPGLIAGEAIPNRLYDLVSDRQGILVKPHDLDDSASGADGVPIVVDFVE